MRVNILKFYGRPIIVISLLAILLYFALTQQESISELEVYLNTLDRPYAATIFTLCFTLGALFLIPSSVFMIISGAVFGAYWGYLFSMLGFTCGALISFLLSRYVMRDFVSRHMPRRVVKITSDLHQHGWKLVALLRIFGMVPAAVINYAMGITNIKIFDYIWASCIFTLPIGFVYTYAGSVGKEFIANGELKKILLAFTALFVFSICVYFLRRQFLKKNLAQKTPEL